MALPEIPTEIAVTNEQLTTLRSWDDLFGRSAPVELEIGIGKGGFLLNRARQLPDRNFLGIEWANEFFRYAADRMHRWGVDNVRVARSDARAFIEQHCPRQSLAVLHVYHPDPWPKKRHHKRRLFQPAFVSAAVECLIPGGHWSIQTDHAEYFAQIVPLLRARPELVEVPFHDAAVGIVADGAGTNFEIKYRREGRPIYQIAMRRVAD